MAKAAVVRVTVAVITIAVVTIAAKSVGAVAIVKIAAQKVGVAANKVGVAIKNVVAPVVIRNGAGGTGRQMRSLRGLGMKKPNGDGRWMHSVADVVQKTIVDPTSVFAKTSTTVWARIIISTLLKSS
jgi:hypothetical protein